VAARPLRTVHWARGGETANQIAAGWSDDQRALYAAGVGVFRQAAAAAERRGASPDEVARAVEHALTASRPRTRYLVGRDARRRARVERLPDRLRDRVLARYLGLPH
jgi:NAD(P)-dependent dehydrogenase (short-subunit alcohol dehydrogenase family)